MQNSRDVLTLLKVSQSTRRRGNQMFSRLHGLGWYTATATAIAGVIGVGMGWRLGGTGIVAAGSGVLAVLALATAWRVTRADVARPVGGTFAISAGALTLLMVIPVVIDSTAPTDVRVVALATGVQALLHAVDARPSNASRSTHWLVPLMGHGAVFAGSGLALEWGPFEPGVALLAYATGFSSLALHVFWMRQFADDGVLRTDAVSRWEAVLLVALIAGVASAAVASFAIRPGTLVPHSPVARTAAIVAGAAAVVTLAMLAKPPSPPSALEPLTGIIVTVLEHAATLIILLNAFLLAVLLVFSWSFLWVLGAFLAFLALGVAVEYLAVAHAHRRRGETSSPPLSLSRDAPVTVVVTAANEAGVLPESLTHNLGALEGLSFILVPAAKSTDGTVKLAREFQADYPERVRVIEGTTGSKAGDLNLAWRHVDTPYALVLDADETVDAEFVARGLGVLREHPEVGVVQGRKAAARPDAGVLSRYVSAERRFSTWVDHPFVDDVFGAGHFAGSAAIFRREVPSAVDGWRPNALTEDIDLTLRLYLQTDWRVTYVPEMVAREAQPATLRALVRQRVRWARGWAQVAALYGGDVLQSWRNLGWRRALGLAWLLFTSVSAPVSTIFPALVLLWLVGVAPAVPLFVALPLALFMLPARAVSFGYASLHDPVISVPATPVRVGEVVLYAYLWILFGWFIQLHALYLQLAGAPRLWYVTEKANAATSSAPEKPSGHEAGQDRGPA